jgi:hypothetical protein
VNVLKSATEWLKLPSRILLSIACVCALILFAPNWFLAALGLLEFVDSYRHFVGLALLLSLVLPIFQLIFWTFDTSLKLYTSRRDRKSRENLLKKLTVPEKKILCQYLVAQSKTQYCQLDGGVVAGLAHQGLIYRVTTEPVGFTQLFAYNVQPWIWDYLNQHPEILEPDLSALREELEKQKKES